MAAFVLALLGLLIGIPVEGIVASYHKDGTFWPWPRCRECGAVAPPRVVAPVVGFVSYRHCAGCRRSHWARALQVQAITALAFFALGQQYWTHPVQLLVSLAEAAVLVAVLFIDAELRLIPTFLVGVLVVLALGSAAVWPGVGLWSAVLGGAIAYVAFLALVVLAQVFFGEGALGMGDANLALAIGCITGYPLVVFSLAAGVLLGGIGAMGMLVLARRGLHSTMPYGPYLVLATLYVLAHGNMMNPAAQLLILQ